MKVSGILMKSAQVVCLCALTLAGHFACAQAVAELDGGVAVGPGVMWKQESVAEGPLSINVMRVQLDDPRITIESESAHDKLFVGEKVHQTAKREAESGPNEIVGAINGDFFGLKNFTPVGLLVADGMIYGMPSAHRSAFVLTKDESPYIGRVTLEVSLRVNGTSQKINGINSRTKNSNSTILFTPPFGTEVGPAPGRRFLLTMKGPEFLPNQHLPVAIAEVDSKSTTPLNENQMVLQIPSGKNLKGYPTDKNARDGILSAVLPEVSGVVSSVCGGWPAIVVNGKVDVRASEEKMVKSLSQKHPRTAIGFSNDKKVVYLVTVDGRQPRLSVGLTLDELGAYMKQIGCWSALNLDGGGSTSMVINGKVVNHPSDLMGPRTVANSLLVVTTGDNEMSSSVTTVTIGNKLNTQSNPVKQY